MKTLKYIACGLSLMAAVAMTSCQDHYDEPTLEIPKATMEPTISIADFKAEFADELAVKVPLMDAEKGIPYIIHGRVISSDASGNIYKSLVIQDETAAIALSINQSSMYIDYRLGQEIVICATDMWMGMYNNYLQLGMLGEYDGSPQITFMAFDTFKAHSQLNGMPNQDFKYVNYGKEQPSANPYCLIFRNFSEIPSTGQPYIDVMSQLVEFSNVSFVDADGETTFAPYQDNADRYIKDANGAQLNVRCSGYSSFYNDPLPQGTGTVRGILSRYGDSWQLLLRGTDDLIFDNTGSRDKPYTVEQAIAMNNNGRTGWVEGYIIGSVKTGVSNVTSADDIIFSAAAEIDNNVVIAADPTCRNTDEMMIVELPTGSRLREWGNLIDNPDNFGKKLYVKGSLNEWLGMHGVTDSGSGYSDFQIEGQVIPGITGGGNGTQKSPYTIDYILAVGDEELSNVYIKGYIVGWVSGKTYATGAHFTSFSRGDYNGNNVIISASPDVIDTEDAASAISISIPVSLNEVELRNEFGLQKNPAALGREVIIQGNVSTYLGSRGISAVNEMKFAE